MSNRLCYLLSGILFPLLPTLVIASGLADQISNGSEWHPPIVLVHGLGGWGREELAGYRYWGGTVCDIQADLRHEGYEVHTASLGPVSSNHDRACELFYQIRGGRCDYGEVHSHEAGHARYGRSFPGFLADWSEDRPVCLLGHSLGGQTVRQLVTLLEEDAFGQGTNGRWVLSVGTLATPHRGSLATEIDGGTEVTRTIDGITAFIARFGQRLRIPHIGPILYDFDLDHWEIARKPDEGPEVYLARVKRRLGNNEDLCGPDVSPDGARAFTARVPTHPEVFYLSWGNVATHLEHGTHGSALPDWNMYPILRRRAGLIGSYEGDAVENPDLWKLSDGTVSLVSQIGTEDAPIYTWDEERCIAGAWTYMGTIRGKDHVQVLGHLQDPLVTGRWLRPFFRKAARQLTDCMGWR